MANLPAAPRLAPPSPLDWMGMSGRSNNRQGARPPGGSSIAVTMAAIFGERNPATVSSTPRPAGNVKTAAEHVANAPRAVQYGWFGEDAYQTDGMSVLYVDKLIPVPGQGVQAQTKDAIGRSNYAPFVHYRAAHWLYSRWDPIFRFANTALDMRFQVGHPAPLSNEVPYNLPGSSRMGGYNAPFRAAQRVPRFSTEPYTIIPQAGK